MSEQQRLGKSIFYWAVVGDGNPEPVAVQGKKGSRQAFTIGCPDAYNIDEAGCPCRLLPEMEQAADMATNRYIAKIEDVEMDPIEVPPNSLSPKVRRALEKQFADDLAPKHSYAGFGRRQHD